ncbi:hypothetical protein [Streptacidiphilus cavernicola]|uniref:Uncharacterized protein n=1 Tax=Streptacidiphilus cavernicola TaxID=3342716 RepID=A0ABV6W6A6_9ACTN
MSEIMKRQSSGFLLPTYARREMTHTVAATGVAQAKVHAKPAVGEFALSEVSYLKAIQRQAENANPDAAEAIALIVNVTIAGIARSVQQFSAGLD